MALNFLISGTAPRAGKTMVGCALAFAFKVRAMRVGVMKPVQTGCVERDGGLVPEDAAALLAAASSDYPLELVCPYRYSSALAPAAAAEIDKAPLPDLGEIERSYRLIAASSDVMIVEDAAGFRFADVSLTASTAPLPKPCSATLDSWSVRPERQSLAQCVSRNRSRSISSSASCESSDGGCGTLTGARFNS